jgi:hypothetical protein
MNTNPTPAAPLTPEQLDALHLVRQSGTRKEYTIPLSWVYSMAVKAEVARKRAEKAALRKAKGRK